MPSLDRELRLLRAYALLTYPFVCVPFLYLFFRGSGLDLADYGAVVTIYYAAMFVADVPTSVVADRLGQRSMLVLGPLLLGAGFALLFFWRSFTGFCVAEALMGLGHSVLSGPPSSMLYELLRRHDQQHRYLQEEARIHALRLTGTGVSFLLGGLLAWALGEGDRHAYAATILPTGLLCAGAAAIAMRLRPLPTRPRLAFGQFVRQAAADLLHREVRWLLLYWIVLFALLRYPFHNYQVWLDDASVHEPLFAAPLFVGALYALLNLVAAPLSRRVPQLVGRLGRRALFWGMPSMLALSLLAMGCCVQLAAYDARLGRALMWVGVAMFFAQQIPFGLHWALVQEFVNHRIRPDARSTVWSVLSLGGRLAYAPLNVGLFALQQRHGTAPTLGGAGLIGMALVAAVLWLRPAGLLRGPDLSAVSDRGR
ncbi:MAG: MFS transporter [Planctomycetota bacterium]